MSISHVRDAISRRHFAVLSICSAMSLAGCGSITHKERKNRPHSGKLDWAVVWGNIGLTLLFTPLGIIAFIVDAKNGCLYMPRGHASLEGEKREMIRVPVPEEYRNQEGIEWILSRHYGRDVKLDDVVAAPRPLKRLRDFFPAAKRLLGREPQSVATHEMKARGRA